MTQLALHIREAGVEASSAHSSVVGQEPRVYRIPVAVARDRDTWSFGAAALDSYLAAQSDTLETTLKASNPAGSFLSSYLAGIAKMHHQFERAVVCLPETWRTEPKVSPAWIDRELRQALPVLHVTFVGAGQSAGAYAIRRARQAGQEIGTSLLVVTACESECECALFSVEQPNDQLCPIASIDLPGSTAFDWAIGNELAALHGGSTLVNALQFGLDRASHHEALALEWPLIADLPETEVLSSGGAPLTVEMITTCANAVWSTLGTDLAAFVEHWKPDVIRDNLMWTLTGEAAAFPPLREIIEQAVPNKMARRLDSSLTTNERAYATIYGALEIAAGHVAPCCLVGPVELATWRKSPDGTKERVFTAFDPPEVGGYLASQLRLDPNAPARPVDVRPGMQPLSVRLKDQLYQVPLTVPAGRFFLGVRIDQARRAHLEFVRETKLGPDTDDHFSLPILANSD